MATGDLTAGPAPVEIRAMAGLDQWYRDLTRRLMLPAYTIDLDGRICTFNAAAVALWGRAPVTGRDRWSGAVRMRRENGTHLPLELCPLAVALSSGEATHSAVIVVERADGEWRTVLSNPHPVRNAAGAVVSGFDVLIDITDHRGDHDVQARLAAIVETSDDAIISKDLDGLIRSWNAGAEKLYGYTEAEVVGRPVTVLIPAERYDEEPRIVERIRRGERIDHYETVRRRKDGSIVEVSLTVSPLRDAAGRLIGASKIARDIGDRHRAETAHRRLAAIIESSDDAIISKSLAGIIESWNAGAERLFGYTADEAVGRPVLMLIPPDRQHEEPEILDRIRRGERVHHYETVRLRKDGRTIDVSLTVSPVHDRSGRVIGASKIARDISDRKRSEREIAAAHEAAVAASRTKDDFLAALSHELRTPLNPVLLVASNAAADESIPEPLRHDFARIRDNMEMEARLIDDLLDLTRISRGKLALHWSRVSVRAALEQAIRTVEHELQAKKIALSTSFPPEPSIVEGDGIRLQQVFWNVLKNAVKFTPAGGDISVALRAAAIPGMLTVEIVDSGIGMTDAEIARVFEAFAQGEHAARGAHRFGGLGLGLAIARHLVELHGGRINASSVGRDRGSCFTIDLPAAPQTPAGVGSPPAAGSETGGGLPVPVALFRILLVEDHTPTRDTLTQLLQRRGHRVVSAGDAASARRAAAQDTFDLVISDIGLPDRSGYELMAELRAGRALPGIALTGYGTETDRARSHDVGFVAHLTKPVSIQLLDAELAKLPPPVNGLTQR